MPTTNMNNTPAGKLSQPVRGIIRTAHVIASAFVSRRQVHQSLTRQINSLLRVALLLHKRRVGGIWASSRPDTPIEQNLERNHYGV
jgi:hypothetical protein